jgi:hypothetical protein
MLRRMCLGFMAWFVIACLTGTPVQSGENGAGLDDCIHVSIYGNNGAVPGGEVVVPVVISEVTGWGILAFEMEICWCELPAGLLQYEGCSIGPVMDDSDWMPPICNVCAPNCVSVAAASPGPLRGNGPLFYLRFHVSANAKPCMCCDIKFNRVSLYDPEDPLFVCTQDGRVCVDWCDVRGVVKHWYCEYDPCEGWYRPHGIGGVRVHIFDCEGPVASNYTRDDGSFEFLCLKPLDDAGLTQPCYYCVDVGCCGVPADCIGAYDASLILKYLVCSDGLDDCPIGFDGAVVYPQMIAADVNCTKVVTAYDAALILQYVVGIVPTFPCPDMWTWFVLPPGSCALSCPAFMEFVGVLKGDVSGPRLESGDKLTVPTAVMRLGIARADGDFVEIPVLIEDATDVFAAEFEFVFDTDHYSLLELVPAGLASGFLMSYSGEDGHVYAAMASASGFSGNGRMALIRLAQDPTVTPGATVRPSLVSALLNEGVPEVRIETRGFTPVVENFRLGPVSPNPFTNGTVIGFSLAEAADVEIDIYSVNGRLVRSIFAGRADAGAHNAAWDGCDSRGSRVARGVYFCRMEVQGFSATEKVVVLR